MTAATKLQLSAVRRAFDLIGGPTKVATLLGLPGNRPLGTAWKWQLDGVPARYCPALERLTSGAVTVERLQPHLRWVRVPCDGWPWHPQGRPLLDVDDFAVAA
jgi:DNA-binding transcriptional regulator YdaS (Cro superfamily)